MKRKSSLVKKTVVCFLRRRERSGSAEVGLRLLMASSKGRVEADSFRIKRWIKVSNIALRILFPNERRLCQRVFGSSSDISDKCFIQGCSELARILLYFADHFAKNSLEYQKTLHSGLKQSTLKKDCVEQLRITSSRGWRIWFTQME
ncbi:hypothetical protein PIB30_087508 [Stylosanthes scabra]|uniref:Exocyst subunit Exo70 family protein n=1 Tax=Stylosanthes scabra TaxID=79078 RepID=A0ABU6USU2_9FABA|nr:hypothetical protein [Stylosanthes scabra]